MDALLPREPRRNPPRTFGQRLAAALAVVVIGLAIALSGLRQLGLGLAVSLSGLINVGRMLYQARDMPADGAALDRMERMLEAIGQEAREERQAAREERQAARERRQAAEEAEEAAALRAQEADERATRAEKKAEAR